MGTVLVIFIAPIIGYTIDIFGGQLIVSILSSILVLIAFSLFIYTFINPVLAVLLLSISESFLPTILLSIVPLIVQHNKYGTAFGLVEIAASITGIFGNVIMGYIKDITNTYYYDLMVLYVLAILGTVLLVYLQVQYYFRGDFLRRSIES